MWNGVYYRLAPEGDGLVGAMHEMDMNILAATPSGGDLRPIGAANLEPADPESHWLQRLNIEQLQGPARRDTRRVRPFVRPPAPGLTALQDQPAD
ncbi:MAG: hypothetical protein AAGC86_17735 [Pseudomonadota bacterium]